MMVSAGLDAVVVAKTRPGLKKILGKAALGLQFILEWIRYGYPLIRLVTGATSHTGTMVVASNIPFYGGPHRMALVLFSGSTRLSVLGLGRDLLLGRQQKRRDITLHRGSEATIQGPPSLSFQLDGDTLHVSPPLQLAVSPHKLRMLVP
jgi:diacylglycerol kinase family enzyme